MAQNGATTGRSAGDPHQPAWIVATIIVATEKPARPRIDGAAIGWRNTRGRANPSRHSVSSRTATPAEARSRRSSIVLMSCDPFHSSYYDSHARFPANDHENL